VGGEATDIHDHAGAAALEMRQAGFHAIERAVEDDGGDGAPVGKRHGRERLLGAHRRVVDQNVDAAEFLRRGRDHRIDRVGVGDVSGDGKRLAARPLDLVRDRLGLPEIGARIDHDRGAAVGERERDAAPDIAPSAGDDRDAAGQFLLRSHLRSPA
jgi:hypothetical protein